MGVLKVTLALMLLMTVSLGPAPATAAPWLPGAPQNIQATANETTATLTMTWEPPEGASAGVTYLISRNGVFVATVASTTYSEPLPNLTSQYTVWAVQAGAPPVPSAPILVNGLFCEGPFYVYFDNDVPFVMPNENVWACIDDIVNLKVPS